MPNAAIENASLYERVTLGMQWLQTYVDQGWSTWEDVRDDFDMYGYPLHAGFII